jgi:PEP-CTERM motif
MQKQNRTPNSLVQYKTTLLSGLIALTTPAAFGDISVFIDKSVVNELTFTLSGSIPSGVTTPAIAASVLLIHLPNGGLWAPGGITASNFINNGMDIGGDALTAANPGVVTYSGWGNTDTFGMQFAAALAQNDVVNNGTNAFSLTLDPADYAAFDAISSFDISWGLAGSVPGAFHKGPDAGTVVVGVPEPGSALLGGIGMFALLLRRRRA